MFFFFLFFFFVFFFCLFFVVVVVFLFFTMITAGVWNSFDNHVAIKTNVFHLHLHFVQTH